MHRLTARLLFFLVSAVLLTGLWAPMARADGPVLSAKLGLGGRYRTERWCRVMVGVTNPGPDTISGQVQVLTVATDTGQGRFGRGGMRPPISPAVFACPASVPAGTTQPRQFPVYVRGIDPGQGDLTVQLVEGRERGDGRVLAKISSLDPNQAAAFSGSPVSGSDPLLIGFGGDPGAFLFLNGRHLPVPPQNQNNQYFGNQNTGLPPTVQVAALSAADLPDRAAGYAGVYAFLLRSDAPVEALTEAQGAALRSWVTSGGHLIVCGGPDSTRFGSPFFEGLLPAVVGPAGISEILTLTPKPLPGVHVVLSEGESLGVAGPYGAGTVTITAFDPKAPSNQSNLAALPPVWKTLLARQNPLPALRLAALREENTGQYYYYNNGGGGQRLSETVIRGPSLDAPGTSVIAIFLLVYLVILVPVNYLVLKKLDRKEWAWLTIPALVLAFAAGTFGVGYAAKGGSVFVNRAALVETSAGHSEAGVYSEVGLFSPHRSFYDIDLPGNNLVAAIPNANLEYGRGGDTQGAGGAQFVETPSGVSLVSTPVNMWAMRAFDTQSTVELGGAMDGNLSALGNTLTGTLMNHTAYALSNCAVLYQGQWRGGGSLASGATLTLLGTEPVSGDLPLPLHTDDAHTDIHERMQAALGSYFRSLAQTDAAINGKGMAQAAFAPSRTDALLVGWSRDPKLAGPSPKIDGHSVTENDVSLLVVHVSVK